MSLLSELREDLDANRNNPKALLVLGSYRVAHALLAPESRALQLAGLPVQVAHRVLVEWVLGVEIPAKASLGPGARLFHGQGLVVHRDTVFGRGVTLRQNTTIGNVARLDGTRTPCPVIGDNVDIGANVVILGDVKVGDGARIGAGAVVVKDVPAGAVVLGPTARILERG